MGKVTSMTSAESKDGSIFVDDKSRGSEVSKSYNAGIVARNVRSKASFVVKAGSIDSDSSTSNATALAVESLSMSRFLQVLGRRVRLCWALSSYRHAIPREVQLEHAGMIVSHRIFARVHASQHLFLEVGRPTGLDRQ